MLKKRRTFIIGLGAALLCSLFLILNVANVQAKQVLQLGAQAPLDTIDISTSTGYGQTGNIFESLYRLGKKGKIEAGLAKSSQVSDDGLTWTFKIRKAQFSNGDPIRAQDFVYSWQRTIKPTTKSPYTNLFSNIKNAPAIADGKLDPKQLGVKALDKHTLQVTLTKPVAYMKTLMAYPLFAPQDQKVIEKYGKKYATKSKYMVYSGPFTLQGWSGTSEEWQFKKNPRYWDHKKVKLSAVKFTVLENTSTALYLYQDGRLDLTQLDNQQVENYSSNRDFKRYPYAQTYFLKYNFNSDNQQVKHILNNQDARLALSLAINRKTMNNRLYGFKTNPVTGFVASGLANSPVKKVDFAKSQAVPHTVDYEPKLAKEYWQKALKATGMKKVTLSLTVDSDDPNTSYVSQYLKGQLEEILPGFHLNLRTVPSQVASSRDHEGDYDILLSAWGADFKDPISFLEIMLPGAANNTGGFKNADYQKNVDLATNQDANDPSQRWADMVEAAQVLNRTQSLTPLYQNETGYLQNPKVKGIIHNTAGTQWSYKTAYIKGQ